MVSILSSLIFKEGLSPSPSPFFSFPTHVLNFIQLGKFILRLLSSRNRTAIHVLPTFKVLKNEITFKMIIFSGWQFFSSFLSRVPPFFFNHFRFHSAGINSSPDSSHFVRHHADDYLWREQQKNLFFASFSGPRTSKRRWIFVYWLRSLHLFCLLIGLLQRLSDVSVGVSIQVLSFFQNLSVLSWVNLAAIDLLRL